jgi:hypothetical protein
MESSEPRKDFFISYNKADRAYAEWIAWQLEEKGKYQVILQAWDFLAGGNFVVEMLNAAEQAHCTIAVLSPEYLTALFTKPEWAAAFVEDPTGEKGILMPVRVRECKIPKLLKSLIYIDLVGLETEQARERLLAEVKRQRRKPDTEPLFPGQAAPLETRAVTHEVRFPGSLPPIWNVPHRRNPNFTGREELLDGLREVLALGEPAALCGLGGKGKTALAVEYVYRNQPYYELVWWLRSEKAATLAADYAALAGPLGLPEKDAPDQEAQVRAVRQHLGRLDQWLLIFDNAVRPEDVEDFLPPGNPGAVLITSRYPHWEQVAKPLEVGVMEPQEAVDFLLRRTAKKDAIGATTLAQELGFFPLALEQAGAYLKKTGKAFADYLKLFQTQRTKLFQSPLGKPASQYEFTVATTWEVSLGEVQKFPQPPMTC